MGPFAVEKISSWLDTCKPGATPSGPGLLPTGGGCDGEAHEPDVLLNTQVAEQYVQG
jgi:hypothetical protein